MKPAQTHDVSKEDYSALLRGIPFFSGLTQEELSGFVRHATHQVCQKRSQIFQYGDAAEYFYVVLEGWVKLYHVNTEGEETVIALVTKGDVFSEVATFEGSDYPYSAQVVGGNAHFLIIPAYVIRKKVQENPDIALKMLASVSHHMNQLSLTFEHITKLTTAQRVGCFLLKLSLDNNNAKLLKLPYNKYLVSSRLGMQAETFSRAMRRLRQDLGIVFQGREVTIPSLEELQAYCEVFCFDEERCSRAKRLLCTNPQCDIFRILKLM